jgi:hypothetical protein
MAYNTINTAPLRFPCLFHHNSDRIPTVDCGDKLAFACGATSTAEREKGKENQLQLTMVAIIQYILLFA